MNWVSFESQKLIGFVGRKGIPIFICIVFDQKVGLVRITNTFYWQYIITSSVLLGPGVGFKYEFIHVSPLFGKHKPFSLAHILNNRVAGTYPPSST